MNGSAFLQFVLMLVGNPPTYLYDPRFEKNWCKNQLITLRQPEMKIFKII